MSIILSESFPTSTDGVNHIKVEIHSNGMSVDVVRDVTERDPPQAYILWTELDEQSIEYIADKFQYESLVMFKTLVPMLIKAKTLRTMI